MNKKSVKSRRRKIMKKSAMRENQTMKRNVSQRMSPTMNMMSDSEKNASRHDDRAPRRNSRTVNLEPLGNQSGPQELQWRAGSHLLH